MGPPRRGEARRRHGRLLLLLAVAGLGALWLPTSGAADQPTVEPTETASGFAWKPATVTAVPGGNVAFRNPGAVTPHGVHWTGGPEKPSCSGVPVDNFGTNWSGTCTFTQAGTYTFVCTVHPEEMKGTITVASGEPPTTPQPGPVPPSPAPEGHLVEALQLARNQQGGTIHGSIAVSAPAVGGRLIVELGAARSTLGAHGAGTERVGKLSRGIAGVAQLSFAVRLLPTAARALNRRGRLSVIVNIAVKPSDGVKTTLTRRVKLHA